MYGLVNIAVKDLVVSNFGEDKWQAILNTADIDDADFASMEAYDDAISYSLVGAATEVLGLDAETILQTFGEYWITYTAEKGYGPILDMAGNNFGEFLKNLNTLHDNVAISFPDLKPPFFEVDDVGENEWRLQYFSEREGLVPMMVGLLNGLAKKFDATLEFSHSPGEKDGQTFELFNLKLL